MNSNKEVIINLREAKILGFSTLSVILMLGGGASYINKVDIEIEETMVLLEDDKLAYKEYFAKVYSETLATGQVDVHIWEDFIQRSNILYLNLTNVKEPVGTFNIANKERPFLNKYLSANERKQKAAESLVNCLRREVEHSTILTGKTRKVYDLRNNKRFFEVLKEYKIFVDNL